MDGCLKRSKLTPFKTYKLDKQAQQKRPEESYSWTSLFIWTPVSASQHPTIPWVVMPRIIHSDKTIQNILLCPLNKAIVLKWTKIFLDLDMMNVFLQWKAERAFFDLHSSFFTERPNQHVARKVLVLGQRIISPLRDYVSSFQIDSS